MSGGRRNGRRVLRGRMLAGQGIRVFFRLGVSGGKVNPIKHRYDVGPAGQGRGDGAIRAVRHAGRCRPPKSHSSAVGAGANC
jgi:hypothetical protein